MIFRFGLSIFESFPPFGWLGKVPSVITSLISVLGNFSCVWPTFPSPLRELYGALRWAAR